MSAACLRSEPVGGETARVCFEGTLSLSVCNIPVNSLVDLTAKGTHTVYLCSWLNGQQGKSCDVLFSPDGKGVGTFRFDLDCRIDDFDALKVQATMRMRDQETSNLRTVPLCSSYACMNTMLCGEEDAFRMRHPFVSGEFGDIAIRISNAKDFRNHPASVSMDSKPLFALKASNIGRIVELNKMFAEVSGGIQQNIRDSKAKIPRGVGTMVDGLSRYTPPPPAVLFLSLMLGTPAYILLFAQPGVRRSV